MFWGSIILIGTNIKSLKIEKDGLLVSMRIVKMPESCLGTKVKHFISLDFNGETFLKRVGGQFCDTHHPGEFITMKYLAGYDEVLFPNESVLRNLISFGLLGVVGLGIIVYYWKRYSRWR